MAELIYESDYQDIYRIQHGVLFFVNKFKYISNGSISNTCDKPYQKSKYLRITLRDYNMGNNKILPKGTVLFNHKPVQLTDKDKWIYQLKIGDVGFEGTAVDTENFLDEVKSIVQSYTEPVQLSEDSTPKIKVDILSLIICYFDIRKRSWLSISLLESIMTFVFDRLMQDKKLELYETNFNTNPVAIEKTVLYNSSFLSLDADGELIYLDSINFDNVLKENPVDDYIKNLVDEFLKILERR